MTTRPDQFTQLWATHETELQSLFSTFAADHQALITTPTPQHPDIRRHTDGTIAGSVNLLDALYLYTLVRHFKPKVIFEIGTWTGMSARFMAEAIRKNGVGHIYTCDVNSYYLLGASYEQEITRLNTHSAAALTQLPPNTAIDMVFLDGDINADTITPLRNSLSEQAVIATHDFEFPGEKGVRNLVGLQQASNHQYTYVRPNIPNWLQEKTGIRTTSISFLAHGTDNQIRERLKTLYYYGTLILGALYRRGKKFA